MPIHDRCHQISAISTPYALKLRLKLANISKTAILPKIRVTTGTSVYANQSILAGGLVTKNYYSCRKVNLMNN